MVEGVAEALAREVTLAVPVPTIGIGASSGCDGQILVTDDMLGMFEWTPKFVRRYADLKSDIAAAVRAYADDVRARRFPAKAETYFAKARVGARPVLMEPSKRDQQARLFSVRARFRLLSVRQKSSCSRFCGH